MRPVRMCAVCRERKDKDELLRITKTSDGGICVDISGKMPGRGAYICKSGECIKNAQKRRVLERAFSVKVEADVYNQIEKTGEI